MPSGLNTIDRSSRSSGLPVTCSAMLTDQSIFFQPADDLEPGPVDRSGGR
jgi:hypothetical protein